MSSIAKPFDYTSRDFDSLTADLRRRMLKAIPDWTTYEQGFETILLEMYAYVGDILNFYIDRMGNEAYLQTAVLRESVLNIATMFGYTPGAQTAATCTLQFTKLTTISEDLTIPAGTQVYAQSEGSEPVFFETVAPLLIPLANSSGSTTGAEGRTITEELIGTSTGAEDQDFTLYFPAVIKDSTRVFTKDGPVDPISHEPTLIEWTFFERIVDANFYNRAYTLYVDEEGYTHVRFGDNVSGQVPAANVEVYCTYRYGAGVAGNLGIGSIKSFVTSTPTIDKLASVTNTTASQGGSDAETLQSMRTSIPLSLRTIERAVSTDDYANLALRVGGVAKASSGATVSTSVLLNVAPVGGGQPTANLINTINAYFDGPPSRKMIGTTITVTGPTYVPINMTISLTVNARYRRDAVVTALTTVVQNLYSFDNRSFAQLLSKAEVFQAIIQVPGADYVDITVFSKTGSGTADIQLLTQEIAQLGTLTVNATGGIVLS